MAEMLRLNIRADGGAALGYGHLQRTCAVATALKETGPVEVRYLVREGTDIEHIQRRGASVRVIEGTDWMDALDPLEGPLLVDTYETTETHLRKLEKRGVWTAVFDDGCRLKHYSADLVIDASPAAPDLPYKGDKTTRFALGATYVPLRPEFLDVQQDERAPGQGVRLLLTFGGSDPEDLTARLLPFVDRLGLFERITVILGPGYQGRFSVADAGGHVVILRNVRNMADVMAQADIAVAASGGTALELAYMGIPAVLIPLTPDQRPIAQALAQTGAALALEGPHEADEMHLSELLDTLISEPERRAAMARAGQQIVDGQGAARIAEAIRNGWQAHGEKR